MSSQYAGNPNNFPLNYTIPDDAEPPTAAAFNVAAEALGDRTAFLRTHGGAAHELVKVEFGTPGAATWTCPPRVRWIWLFLLGGGGGGGHGFDKPGAGASQHPSGGGGGGGAQGGWHMRSVTPGVTYHVNVGNGGAGATTPGNPGGDGDESVFSPPDTQDTVAAYGGSGGRQGTIGTSTSAGFALGGGPALATRYVSTGSPNAMPYPYMSPGDGGWAATGNQNFLGNSVTGLSANGCPAPYQAEVGFRGIQSHGGMRGTNVSGAGGGTGGGGGGSSTLGPGGDGGAGGAANGSGAGSAGGNGANALIHGAGGGGGGGGGVGTTTGGAGGKGGAGASGLVRILYVRPDLEVP